MMKSILSLFALLTSLLMILTQTDAVTEYAKLLNKRHRPYWLTDSHRNRIEIFKKWIDKKPVGSRLDEHFSSSPYDALHSTHQFKGMYY